MAEPEPGVIAAYTADLRRRLRRRPDADDLVAEAEEHLSDAAARHRRDGFEPGAAQGRAVREYGTPAQVARLYRNGSGTGIAIPTALTKLAGVVMLIAPFALAGAVALLGNDVWIDPGNEDLFAIGSVVAGIALAGVLIGFSALRARHAERLKGYHLVAFLSVGLSTLVCVGAAWAAVIWVPLLAIGCVATTLALRGARHRPRVPATLLGPSALVCAGAAIGLVVAGGEHASRAALVAFGWVCGIGFLGLTVALAWLGLALGLEEEVVMPGRAPVPSPGGPAPA